MKKHTNKKHPDNLSDIGNETPYKTPDNYFDNFPGKIMNRINSRKRAKRIITVAKPYLAVVSIFVIIFLAWNFVITEFVYERQKNQEIVRDTNAEKQTDKAYNLYQTMDTYTMMSSLSEDKSLLYKDSLSVQEREAIINYLSESDMSYYAIASQ